MPIVLVGNKVDKISNRKVKAKQITFHRKKNLQYYHMSVKDNVNVGKPFIWLARKLLGDSQLQVRVADPEPFVHVHRLVTSDPAWLQHPSGEEAEALTILGDTNHPRHFEAANLVTSSPDPPQIFSRLVGHLFNQNAERQYEDAERQYEKEIAQAAQPIPEDDDEDL